MRIDTSKRLGATELEKDVLEYISPFDFEFTVDQTVGEVLEKLHTVKREKQVEYFYVTDHENHLQGIAQARDLLYNPPQTRLIDIIDPDVIKISEHQPLEVALNILANHKILALPVVDKENRFKGVVEVVPHQPDLFANTKRLHFKNIKQDIFQFIGFSIEQRKLASPWIEFRYRMPWLLCNLVGGLICAVIGEFFQQTVLQFVVLALFVPLVLTLSESIAIQSMTLSLRFLHFKTIDWKQVLKRILVEWKTSLILGICSALLLSCFYFAWSTALLPVFSISISIVVSMVFSATFGAFFPILLHALKLDPKVAAGPVVLMMADVVTVAIYYSLATAILMGQA
ncbi:MAG: Magnesium transporter MgtE [Chlamydiales bacterium]|nr:Magnesium transporter MgtE [Chlamydiales bacterium]MCH9619214.1 Magnesium transporter MgtE [Chlamydiales bacterium]MCH9622476.1 Magnesium transporter MgtE [Chlamydiales bacterium]